MKTANIVTAKNELSRLLRCVKRGETIVITERNRPVARLQPIDAAASAGNADIEPLIASGALLPPSGSSFNVAAFLAAPRARLASGRSLAAAVIAEREEGR
jgi:prevent-host-death family protein